MAGSKMKNINIDKRYIIILLIISLLLIFPNLGERNLGGDEVPTSIYAENALINGRLLITRTYDEPYYEKIGEWKTDFGLSYYILSFFYFLFGISNFVSRLPFAIFGVLTVPLFYYFCKYFFKHEKKAFLCTLLLLFNYMFLISVRQARYYSMAMFFTIFLVFSYLKMLDSRGKFFYLPFIISNIVFFYLQTQLWFYISASLAAHFFIFGFNKKKFYRLFYNSLISSIIMVPWLIYWVFLSGIFSEKSQIHGLKIMIFNIGLIYFFYFLLYFPIVILILVFLVKSLRKVIFGNKRFYLILSLIIGVSFFYSIITHANAPQVRKLTTMLLPFFTILIFQIFYHLYHKTPIWRWISVGILAIFMTSNILAITPFYPLKMLNLEERVKHVGFAPGFINRSIRIRYETLQYFYELFSDYQSIDESIIRGFSEHGLIGCNCSVISDISPNLNFHFIRKQLNPRFYVFNKHIDNISDFSIILLNFEENKKRLSVLFKDGTLNISDYNYFEINDYMETMWIDHPSPINRRIKKSDKDRIYVYYASRDIKKTQNLKGQN